jgi:hypothetical protein
MGEPVRAINTSSRQTVTGTVSGEMEITFGDLAMTRTGPRIATLGAALALGACSGLSDVGKTPDFTPLDGTAEERAMRSIPMQPAAIPTPGASASLWGGQPAVSAG